jgi:hypothetical protein
MQKVEMAMRQDPGEGPRGRRSPVMRGGYDRGGYGRDRGYYDRDRGGHDRHRTPSNYYRRSPPPRSPPPRRYSCARFFGWLCALKLPLIFPLPSSSPSLIRALQLLYLYENFTAVS